MDKSYIPEAIANESQPNDVQNYGHESIGNLAQEGVIRLSGTQSDSSPVANNPIVNVASTPNQQAVVAPPETPILINLENNKITNTSYWKRELEKAKV